MQHHFRHITKCLFMFGVLLALTTPRAPAQPADAHSDPERAPQPTLEGRLVDEAGEPVADVPVYALTTAAGPHWSRAQMHVPNRARSDEEGRFKIVVPFADLPYKVGVNGAGAMGEASRVFPGDAVEINCARNTAGDPLRGRLRDGDGKPVANVKATLIGRFGLRRVTATDERGRFRFDNLPNGTEEATVLARHDGRVTPLHQVQAHGRPTLELALTDPLTVTGRIVDAANDEPVDDATVVLASSGDNDFQATTQSGKDGSFTFTDLPPGNYVYYALAPNHYFPRVDRRGRIKRFHPKEAGRRIDVGKIGMHARATVRGRVVTPDGKPVPNAGVVGPRFTTTFTDAQGRFTLRAPGGTFNQPLCAFSPTAGLGHFKVDDLRPGEQRNDITVQLNGATRVTGRVTDPHGMPIADVTCSIAGPIPASATTDGDGRFDLGAVALPAENDQQSIELSVKPPRPIPMLGAPADAYADANVKQITGAREHIEAQQYYAPHAMSLQPTAGERTDVKVELEPTDLLTLRGRVTDTDGKAINNVHFVLFAGSARPNGWAERRSAAASIWHETLSSKPILATPSAQPGSTRKTWSRVRGGGEVIVLADRSINNRMFVYESGSSRPEADPLFTHSLKDAHGRFTLYVLRSDGRPSPIRGGRDRVQFSLGIVQGKRITPEQLRARARRREHAYRSIVLGDNHAVFHRGDGKRNRRRRPFVSGDNHAIYRSGDKQVWEGSMVFDGNHAVYQSHADSKASIWQSTTYNNHHWITRSSGDPFDRDVFELDDREAQTHLIRSLTFDPDQSQVRIQIQGTAKNAFESKVTPPGPQVLMQWESPAAHEARPLQRP